MQPALRILASLLAGALIGAFIAPHAPWVSEVAGRLAGEIFLKLLLVLVMPLAAAALFLGITELPGASLGGLAGRAFALTIGLTAIAVGVGVGLVTLVQPGAGMDRAGLPAGTAPPPVDTSAVDALLSMIPNNVFTAASKGDLLGVLLVAVLLGIAARGLSGQGIVAFRATVQGIFDACSSGVQMVMKLAPIGVAGLACTMAARVGLEGLLPLGRFTLVVVGAIGIQALIVYPLALRLLAGRDPVAFYRAAQPALAMAFSTASSAATLPTSLRVAEENHHLPGGEARFVLTVGASANQNGTALFEGVAVLFLAQLYGVELSLAQQAFITGIAVLAGIGTAGVPGASLPVIAALGVAVGVPAEAVGVLVGIDRFLDMCRTTLNVAGDLVIAAIAARPESG